MKDRKRRVETFMVYDHTGIEAHLEHMAGEGWLVEKIGPFFWTYRRIEPQALTFSVCYFPQASQFDPEPSEGQRTFYDFCEHTGWTLAAANAQLQVFYNERATPVPIETDPVLEVDAIHRTAKKTLLYPQLLLLASIALNIGTLIGGIGTNHIRMLASSGVLMGAALMLLAFLMLAVEVLTYFLWWRRALKAAEQGEFLGTRGHPVFQKVMGALVVIVFTGWLASMVSRGSGLWVMVGGFALAEVLVILLMVNVVKELLKRKKVSAGANRAVTYGLCIALACLLSAAVPVLIIRFGFGSLRQEARPEELPLSLENLLDVEVDGYALDRDLEESPLLVYDQVRQYPGHVADMVDMPGIAYSVVTVKASFLYGVCRHELLYRYDTRGKDSVPEGWKGWYQTVDPAPWGAAEAYRHFYQNSGAQNEYLLCYPDRIVEIDFDWEPTPAQMAVVGERLGG